MMHRVIRYRPRDDHFLVPAVFPFRYPDLVEIKYEFCLHPLDIFSQTADGFVQENTRNLESRVFLKYTFGFC
jgi:hypothetical protein